MAQKQSQILPLFLDTDSSFEKIESNAAPFLKNLGWDINANPKGAGIGADNNTGEGQNFLALTPVRSNVRVPDATLPEGINKNHGAFESVTTQELYYFNWNSNRQYGIYVLGGNTGLWTKIIIDPELDFSDDQEAFAANHRVGLRFVLDKNKNITEKHLVWTDGEKWQGWVNVIAATQSNGFDATLYPYWALKQPHFDRKELLEWPVRPPMIKPIVEPTANTQEDAGKINRLIDKSFLFASDFQNTDGRQTALSPTSLPLIIKSEDFLNNPDNLQKKAKLTLYAGSPLTEKINIYYKKCNGNWYLYDTISKFDTAPTGAYWLRVNPWAGYNYDPVFNTIEYTFDNSKVGQIVDQDFANRLQNDIPQLSVGLSDLGDAYQLGNNRYFYDNFEKELLRKLNVVVKEKENSGCLIPLRKITLYAYIGQMQDAFTYDSQVGYYLGDDKQMRFGGLQRSGDGTPAFVDTSESKYFKLDFADRNALRCYLKGTPYYADGKWIQVNSDNSIVEIENLLDFDNEDVKRYANGVLENNGYFACKFEIFAPAGRYIAALGRHNTPSSSDWRNTSTYVKGIANSRIKSIVSRPGRTFTWTTIKPNAVQTFSKEQEVDCVAGDVDVWGNGQDLFYVFCPFITNNGNKKYRFQEGYIKESIGNSIQVEMFPYRNDHSQTDDCGEFTDKNGFYWTYTKANNADEVSVQFQCKLNCAYPTYFLIPPSQTGIGWIQNAVAYLADHNSGVVGDCNRMVLSGSITNLDGTFAYSNIAISLKDGATVLTRPDGTFTLIVHNGQSALITKNVYVNASGNFLITIANCGSIPLFLFQESLVPCVNCTERIYPLPLNLAINVQSTSQTSLKEGGKYSVGLVGADLAGRLTFVNVVKEVLVTTFAERDNVAATYLQLLVTAALNFTAANPDIKWISPYISKNTAVLRYVQWVGDSIDYIDNNGNIVDDPSSAVFCSIKIDSLYNYNITNNFSVLATYQFVTGDRLRILDDGAGNLYDVANDGEPIDLQILGTNYNQVAINAGLLKSDATTIINTVQQDSQSITLIVRYDQRLDKVIDKEGFWIEMYTPTQESDTIPFCEVGGFYPVINGEICKFIGIINALPQYSLLTEIDLDFWDTYLISRSITIPDVGNKFFSHPFESPNISDDWGANCSSCGRQWIKNDNARQMWFPADTIKSDNFVREGLINGLGTFLSDNRKDFSSYPWGGITAIVTARNLVLFICQNDWFVTDYNFHYSYANEQGVIVTNLNDGLSTPHQKTGAKFGCAYEDTGSIVVGDGWVSWYDRKNSGYIVCDYRDAKNVSQSGMQSYFNAKTDAILNWNNNHDLKDQFDVMAGLDMERDNIYVTFRPRRNNSNNEYSYVNLRRNWELLHQETIVYNMATQRWVRAVGFTPESYGKLRGNETGVQLISFGAGVPYLHNSSKDSFNEFFGVQTEPVISVVMNEEKAAVKILQSQSVDSNPLGWYVDLAYTNERNSFSYTPLNYFKKKENVFYASVLRDMNSYPPINKDETFRSMLQDGKRVFGLYFVLRFVGRLDRLNDYNELKNIYFLYTQSGNNKK